jgi:hypothetical protein
MKRLINPPIQSLLLLGSVGLLGLAIWSLVSLKLQDESQANATDEVSVHIPDGGVLDVPEMDVYPQMVKAPLFWSSRKALEPAKVEAAAPVTMPVDTALPEGRLIGIIDMGDHLFGVMQKPEGGSVHLRAGDMWGAWKVAGVDPDRLIVALGDQRQDIPLVGDFASPQENPQLAQSKAALKQKMAAKAAPNAPKPAGQTEQMAQAMQTTPPAEAKLASAEPVSPVGDMPFPAETAKQPPALSVKDALEARQRLMASRWGSLSGDPAAAAPDMPGQAAGQ